MKVLIAYGGYPDGIAGAQVMAGQAASHLAGRGHEVAVLSDAPPRPGPTAWMRHSGELARHLVTWRPDVVHAFDLAKPEPVQLAHDEAERLGVPFVLTPCSAAGVWPDPPAAAAACRDAEVVFTLTEAEEEHLRDLHVAARRLRRIPHASELAGAPRPQHFLASHAITGPMVLFAGRLLESKGYHALLGATRQVWQRLPETSFVFIGPGQPAESFDDRRIRHLGVLDEQSKHDALAACALLCLPSSHDVFPLVFIEAWLCGKPVVSGDFAGAHEVVRHGVDGLVTPVRPRAVAAALIELLADGAIRAAMGKAGHERALREFSWAGVAAQYEAGYRQAVRERAG